MQRKVADEVKSSCPDLHLQVQSSARWHWQGTGRTPTPSPAEKHSLPSIENETFRVSDNRKN